MLSGQLQQRLKDLPVEAALGECSLREQRWVVVDLETSGLNLNRDQVLSIGAVVIEDGAVVLQDDIRARILARSQRTNSLLTIVATIFMPLSFIASSKWTKTCSWS